MASHEPQDEPSSGAYDTLRRLERRLDEASEAAERLIADAASQAGGKPPPAGWQVPRAEGADGAGAGRGGDLELLIGVVQSLRDLIPAELQQRLAEALREILLAVRALIDWYLERAERRRAAPVEVQDIPIV
jgi:hypothetical protein